MKTFLFLAVFLFVDFSQAQEIWTKDPENPAVPYGNGGGFNGLTDAIEPSVLYDEATGLYRMWFSSGGSFGPLNMSTALSYDGKHWFAYLKNPILTSSGSEAGIWAGEVIHNGTQYMMFYSATISGRINICLATSTDGISWQKYSGNPIVAVGESGSWDDNMAVYPRVLFDGTTYHMWYNGRNSTTSATGYATSADGIVWIKHPSNPVLIPGPTGSWDSFMAVGAAVARHNSKIVLLYIGSATLTGTRPLGLAYSNDGINWTKHASPVLLPSSGSWDNHHLGGGTLSLIDGQFRLWYTALNASSDQWQIGTATSAVLPGPPNIILNPGFEAGVAPWTFYSDGGGDFTVVSPGAVGNKAARVSIQSPGSNVQLYQSDLTIEANKSYRLSFRAKSKSGSNLRVYLHKHTAPFTSYGLKDHFFDISESWQTFTVNFQTSGFSGSVNDARLRFWFPPYGLDGDEYYIDEVVLEVTNSGRNSLGKSGGFPTSFDLGQNYPNPFNPSTSISFSVPNDSHVRLTIFDALGQELEVLVDEPRAAGEHVVSWNPKDLASGTYWYRLSAAGFLQTKAMTLLR